MCAAGVDTNIGAAADLCWRRRSTKRDTTALVAVTFDKKSKCVRLVTHRVFTPTPGDPIDFEATVERTILDWRQRYLVRQVLFDPFQMAAVSQRLAKALVPIEEFPQTVPNLTAATSNLFDLIQSRSLVLYPDAAMRLAVSRAIITESSRGWKLDKTKQSHNIDMRGCAQHGGARRGAGTGEALLQSCRSRFVQRRPAHATTTAHARRSGPCRVDGACQPTGLDQ